MTIFLHLMMMITGAADKYKNTLTSVEQVQNGDTIYISVTDGTIEADVTGTVKEERIYGEERKL